MVITGAKLCVRKADFEDFGCECLLRNPIYSSHMMTGAARVLYTLASLVPLITVSLHTILLLENVCMFESE